MVGCSSGAAGYTRRPHANPDPDPNPNPNPNSNPNPNPNPSQVHASVQQKRGKRALYYDLTLLLNWRASHTGAKASTTAATAEVRPIDPHPHPHPHPNPNP